jgi:hypothetical protein
VGALGVRLQRVEATNAPRQSERERYTVETHVYIDEAINKNEDCTEVCVFVVCFCCRKGGKVVLDLEEHGTSKT